MDNWKNNPDPDLFWREVCSYTYIPHFAKCCRCLILLFERYEPLREYRIICMKSGVNVRHTFYDVR